MTLKHKIGEISWLAPAGLQISLRIRFVSATITVNTYPSEWIKKYTDLGLMMHDPCMKWVYENTGVCRWSSLYERDKHNIFHMAAAYGINYGAAISCQTETDAGNRSIATFGRSDREFEDAELIHLNKFIKSLHDAAAPPTNITNAEIEALQLLKRGLIIKEVAAELNISENAVKQRMSNARRKFGAKTTVHAASLAQQFGLI